MPLISRSLDVETTVEAEFDPFAPPAATPKRSRALRAPNRADRWHQRTLAVVCWTYLVGALSLWLFLRSEADHRWIATLILFGPRWIALVPLAILLPAALLFHRRSLTALVAASLIVLGPVMGLCIPWRSATAPAPTSTAGPNLRVLTCNIHRADLNRDALAALIASAKPDVVTLQDWASRFDDIFPSADGWYTLRDDELCVLSHYPIRRLRDVGKDNWDKRKQPGSAVCYELALPQGPVPLIDLHLASPHRAFEATLHREGEGAQQINANSAARQLQSQALSRFIKTQGRAVIVAGDFNTPQESNLFTRAWLGLSDAYATAGFGWGYTYHARWTDVRIDHILSGPGWRCRHCEVGPDVGSPHRPVIADFEWLGASNR
jgi:endonuclease/exonuclease/phosphatase (EEP) superfamily protein YafD